MNITLRLSTPIQRYLGKILMLIVFQQNNFDDVYTKQIHLVIGDKINLIMEINLHYFRCNWIGKTL